MKQATTLGPRQTDPSVGLARRGDRTSPSLLDGSNLEVVKGANRSVVLMAVREHQPVSRATLARVTGLNASTVTKIVDELAAAGLLLEGHSTKQAGPGRPTRPVRLNASARFAIGIAISRTAVTAGLVNLNGELVAREDEAISTGSSHDEVMESVRRGLRGLLDACSPGARERVLGIGVGAPGPLRPEAGMIVAPPNFPQLFDSPIGDEIVRDFGLPVFLENDADACALAEQWFGAARSARNFVYLAVGSGVGAGVVVDGHLYRGHNGVAGELGHTTVDPFGPACDCGSFGCLEIYASERRLLELVREGWATGRGAMLDQLADGDVDLVTPALVYRAAEAGDTLALQAIAQVGFYLGVGVVNAINLLDPELVIIGRGVVSAGSNILDPVRAVVSERALPKARRDVRIVLDQLGDRAPVIGAATTVLSRYYANPLQWEAGGGLAEASTAL